ncbi:MAG: hypothetical protein AAFY15_05400, partial [Cyanobacteria bacterium J06648_11]
MQGPAVLTVERRLTDSPKSRWNRSNASEEPQERFVVKVNGHVLAECKSHEDVRDFIEQWEAQAKSFRSGYKIHPDPIAIAPQRRSLRNTAAGKLLQDDPWAAEAYGVAALRSLIDTHGWTEDQVRQLCDYAIDRDFEAWQQRRNLPPRREAAPR